MEKVAEHIPGYSYGTPELARSLVSTCDLGGLKVSGGFTDEDHRYLRLAGEVLADQTEQIVRYWRNGVIASIPHLARHSPTPEGDAIPEYLAARTSAFGNGFSIRACGPTTRIGSTTNRKLPFGTDSSHG